MESMQPWRAWGPAPSPTFQLILGHLWSALLEIFESWGHAPGLHAFPWDTQVFSVVPHILRSMKALGRCREQDEA